MKNNMNAFIPLNNTTIYKIQEYNLKNENNKTRNLVQR